MRPLPQPLGAVGFDLEGSFADAACDAHPALPVCAGNAASPCPRSNAGARSSRAMAWLDGAAGIYAVAAVWGCLDGADPVDWRPEAAVTDVGEIAGRPA
jgi:hypothetical protein